MNNEIIISNIAPQDIIIEGGGSTIGLTAVYVNGVNVTVGSVAYVIVPTKLSELENNVGYITSETDPTVPTYIKQITMSDITSWNNKQNLLVSGTNIKTINNNSILGSGNLDISTSYTAGTGIEITEENVINNSITSYNDLTDRPTIPTHTSDLINNSNFVNGNSLSQVAYTGDYYDLIGKPDLSEYITKYVDNLVNYYTKDFMYGLLPKVSDEDTSITLNNTYPSKLKISLIPSEMTQETTTGKNIIPFINQNFTLNSVNYYVQNGSLYLNGNSTSETSSLNTNFKNNFNFILQAGTYTISHKTGVASVYLYKYDDNSSILTLGTNTASTTFTLSEETHLFIGFYVYQNSFNNVNSEIMISLTGGNYEPYTGGFASPNPQYPQDIHTISGSNKVVVCGKNLFDKNNYNVYNGYFIGTGTASITSESNNRIVYIPCKANTQYTASKIGSKRFGIGYTTTIPTASVSVYNADSNNSGTSISISTGNDAKYLVVYIRNGNIGGEASLEDIINSLQIEVGSTATSYEPYTSQEAQLNLGDLEYSAIGNYKDEFYKATDSDTSLISGKWYLKKNIGKSLIVITYIITLGNNNIAGVYTIANKKNTGTDEILCTKAKVNRTLEENTIYENPANVIIIGNSTDTLQTIKAKFDDSELYYVLATPTYTQITGTLAEQLEYIYNQMLSYQGQTSISQENDDLPFNIVATTLKDISSL